MDVVVPSLLSFGADPGDIRAQVPRLKSTDVVTKCNWNCIQVATIQQQKCYNGGQVAPWIAMWNCGSIRLIFFSLGNFPRSLDPGENMQGGWRWLLSILQEHMFPGKENRIWQTKMWACVCVCRSIYRGLNIKVIYFLSKSIANKLFQKKLKHLLVVRKQALIKSPDSFYAHTRQAFGEIFEVLG